MEIKFELDTEKASKGAIANAATYELCRVSVDTGYPQLAAANTIAIIIIIAILYGRHPAPTIKESSQTSTTMAEACYTARATTKQQVLNGIKKLTLQTNENGQYMHDAILLLQKGIWCVPQSQFNPSDPGQGHGEAPQHR